MAMFWLMAVLSSVNWPTAQALLAEEAATAVRKSMELGLGLGTWVQAVPSQCRIREAWVPLKSESPTAQALSAPVVAAPCTKAFPTGVGLGCCAHVVPVQARISVWSLEPSK